ncbi:hypothetical protein AAZX31_17G189400 [Glycine max]
MTSRQPLQEPESRIKDMVEEPMEHFIDQNYWQVLANGGKKKSKTMSNSPMKNSKSAAVVLSDNCKWNYMLTWMKNEDVEAEKLWNIAIQLGVVFKGTEEEFMHKMIKWRGLRKLISKEEPHLVCLQEIKMENIQVEVSGAIRCDLNVEWHHATVNHGGGLLCM